MGEGKAKADRGECTQLTGGYRWVRLGQVGAASARVNVERCGGVDDRRRGT